MKTSKYTCVLGGLLMCAIALSLTQVSYAVTGCSNAYLSGTYTAEVSSTNFLNVLGALNTSAGSSTTGASGSTGSAGGSTGAVASAGFASNPFSIGGSTPGTSRFFFDGNGNIVGQNPNAAGSTGAGTAATALAGTYSVNTDCTGTISLNTGQKFNAVVVSSGAEVLFLASNAGAGGAVGSLQRSTNVCTGSSAPQSFGFSFFGAQPTASTSTATGGTGTTSGTGSGSSGSGSTGASGSGGSGSSGSGSTGSSGSGSGSTGSTGSGSTGSTGSGSTGGGSSSGGGYPMFVAAAQSPAATTDPVGDFLSTYNGAKNGDMDVVSVQASFDGTNFTFNTVLNGPLGTTSGALYVYGIDRGSHMAPFGAFRPGVLFDSVVVAKADGTGMVVDITANPAASTNLPSGSVMVSGAALHVTVPASMLPTKGLQPSAYMWNLWPRLSLTDNNSISDFAPDNSDAGFALTGTAAGSGSSGGSGTSGGTGTTGGTGSTGGTTTTNVVAFMPFSAVGQVQLDGQGSFTMKEWVYQNGTSSAMTTTGSYTIGSDCSLQLSFNAPAAGSGGSTGSTGVTVPLSFRGALVSPNSGLVVVQPNALATITGTLVAQ